VIAVGEQKAGKSSFIRYLAYGVLLPQQRTRRTLKNQQTAAFELGIGRDRAMRMSVSKAIDTTAHTGLQSQVSIVRKRRPTILLIFLDASNKWSEDSDGVGIDYLTSFLGDLDKICLRDERIAATFKHVAVVLNKIDLISAGETQARLKAIRQCVKSFRAPNWGEANDVSIYQCISVEHPNAALLLGQLIKHVMSAVVDKNA
jgi:hypothetical protein